MSYFLILGKQRPIQYQAFTTIYYRGLIILMVLFQSFISVALATEIQYHTGDRRDPFIPLVDSTGKIETGKAPKDAFKVEGIIYDPKEGSYALIDGKFYKEGDAVANANVASILKDRVILSVNDTEKVVWLREEVVEKS